MLFTCLLFLPFTAKSQDTGLVFGSKVFFFQTDSVQLKRDFKTNRQVFDALDFLLNMPEVYNHIDSILVLC
ncbi:hypothetical protein FACS189426_15700 [Bacteroidia bacterium]|nr:hypothetical protein FACS189426_15700 [Bacteroidia bacterium]